MASKFSILGGLSPSGSVVWPASGASALSFCHPGHQLAHRPHIHCPPHVVRKAVQGHPALCLEHPAQQEEALADCPLDVFLIIFYNDSGIFRYFVYATQRN